MFFATKHMSELKDLSPTFRMISEPRAPQPLPLLIPSPSQTHTYPSFQYWWHQNTADALLWILSNGNRWFLQNWKTVLSMFDILMHFCWLCYLIVYLQTLYINEFENIWHQLLQNSIKAKEHHCHSLIWTLSILLFLLLAHIWCSGRKLSWE